MEEPVSSGASVDGLTASEAPSATPAAVAPAESGIVRRSRPMLLIVGIIAVLYALPGLALLAIFPRTDGALTGLRSGGTMLYAIGGVFWLLLASVGFLRIKSLKDRPRTSFIATLRLSALVVPMILMSVAVPIMINIPPRLQLEIVSPTSADELVAPVAVQFGMATAIRYFSSLGLTPLKVEWDYENDGTVDLETFDPSSTYIVSRAGVYNVVARVTMTDGSVKRVLRRLVVPRSSFGLQPLSPVIDEPVVFSLSHLFPSNAPAEQPKLTKAAWDFDNDGTTDLDTESSTATYTFRRLGTQTVTVNLTLSNQTQQTLMRLVNVVEPPEQPFPVTLDTEPPTLIGPPPFGIFFTIRTAEPIASVSWDFGNQKTGEGLRVAHQFNAVGTYNVVATVRSVSGSIAKLSKHVRVTEPLDIRDLRFDGSPPVKNFVIEGTIPLIVDLSPVTIQSLITFSWDAPGATESAVSGKSIHAVYRDEGRYFIDLLGIDPEEKVFRKRITVNALPAASTVEFSIVPPTPTAPALVTFDASDTFVPAGEQVTGFEWDFGDGNNPQSQKFSGARTEYRFEKPGTYQVTLTVRTLSGKSYSGKKTLLVRAPLLDACFIPSRTGGKAPLGVRFDPVCSTGDFALFRWNFGDGAESDQREPTHVFETPGNYLVTLTATTSTGQSSTTTATISVTQ